MTPCSGLYVVEKGRFRITSYHEDGNEKQIYIAEEGSLCGESECISSLPYMTTALAITNSTVYHIPVTDLFNKMAQSPNLTRLLLEYEVRKNAMLQNQLLSLSFDNASIRIARTLLDLCQRYGRQNQSGTRLTVKFTKSDIAGLVGTSRVTASSEFTKLERNGWISKKNGFPSL